LNQTLIGSFANRSTFTISSVTSVDDVKAFDHFANGRKPLLVEEPVPVLPGVDEDLSGATVGTSGGKHDSPSFVRDSHWVILQRGRSPFGLNFGITRNSELHDHVREDSKDPAVIPKTSIGQLLESKTEGCVRI